MLNSVIAFVFEICKMQKWSICGHFAITLGLLVALLNEYTYSIDCLKHNIPVLIMHGMGDAAENTGMMKIQQVPSITYVCCYFAQLVVYIISW